MKKYVKILSMLLILILLTGCSGNYDLNINSDLSIDEKLELTIDGEENYEKTVKLFEDNKISKSKYKISIDSDEVNIIYKEKYLSFEDYILNSKVYNQIFNEIQYNRTMDYIDLYVDENIKQNNKLTKLNGSNLTDFDVIQVNIKNPYKVDVTNAELINDKTYTWSITKDDLNKVFHMQFKPSLNEFPYRPVIVGVLLLILSTVFIISIYKRYRDTQRI